MPVETEESIRLWEAISSIRNSVTNLSAAVQNSLSNVSTNITADSLSDTKYPSVKAVKTFFNSYARMADGRLAEEINRATAAEDLKENTANKSAATTLGTSDLLFPTQNAVKTYVDSSTGTSSSALANEINRATAAEGTLTTNLSSEISRAIAAEALKESLANKSTAIDLGGVSTSDDKYPTQKAVKTYVDTGVISRILEDNGTQIADALNTAVDERLSYIIANKENTANKSDATTLGTSTSLYPTQNAVKSYVDGKVTIINTSLDGKEVTTNKSDAALGTSTTLYPTQNAVKTYVDAKTVDATTTATGKIQLAGDLGGTATNPTVPGLADKEVLLNKSTNVTADAASDEKYPSVKAVKTYVDANTVVDATTTATGKIKLAGDLGGTASSPTVPGLADKEVLLNKSTNVTTDAASDEKYPSVKAVVDYVTTSQTASDYRIKDDVQTLDDTYTVDNIRPVTYLNTMKNKQDIGVIAHELQAIYPFLVNGEKDGENLQTVNYNGLFGILINEIQRLKQEVKEMRACLSL